MVMKFLGIHLGWIIGMLMPFILIGLGAIGIKNNSKVIGGILIAVGGFMLIGKLAGNLRSSACNRINLLGRIDV